MANGILLNRLTMPDNYDRTPLWGWVLYIAALAMFIGLVVKTLGTGTR
jgi:hypothetical protein